MGERNPIVSPIEMGKALIDALGLQGIPGIVKIQLNCEGGQPVTATVVRMLTSTEAGAFCARLKEWELEIVARRPATERDVRSDGSAGEARTPLFPSSHPREG